MQRKDAKPHGCARLAMTLMLCAMTSGLAAADHERVDDGTAGSANFRVTAPVGNFAAERVLEAAERFRRDIALTWFGDELPLGRDLTFIHVERCDDRDVGLVMLDETGAANCHRIWLMTSGERATGSTLAHEIAHVVLAARFPADMPVWATEGVSCQYDDNARIAVRNEIVARFVRTGRWPSLKRLLEADRIAPTDEISYSAAVSLTGYLTSIRGRREFLDFVASGGELGWDVAVQRHYGLAGVADLNRHWQRWTTEFVTEFVTESVRISEVIR